MNRLLILLLASPLMFFFAKGDEGTTGGEKRVVCYYSGLLAQFGPVPVPEEVDPSLCTHLVIMYSRIDNETDRLMPVKVNLTLSDHAEEGYLNRTAKLKEINPGLKILLHVLGNSFNSRVPNTAFGISRFIESAVDLLSSYGFDGLHFEWVKPRRDNKWLLDQFMTDLRKEFDKHNYLISNLFSEYNFVTFEDKDIDVIKSTSDFIVVKTFEYATARTNVTYIMSPLESIKSTMDLYLAKEIPSEKLLISVASYAEMYKLKNVNEIGVGADLELDEDGFPIKDSMYYSKVMQNIMQGSGNWTLFRDQNTSAPYATSNTGQWISFEDPIHIRMKAAYVVQNNLGGAAIFILDFDDFDGVVGEGRYPLTRALYDVLVRGN